MISPKLRQALFHYEGKDALASADEQIRSYLARQKERKMREETEEHLLTLTPQIPTKGLLSLSF
ncbi:MAG TPA: hypothetical protein VFV38_17510 [Ktedonobacteraceae bacterium]|nr:hypothetical protein [Ktedonobacteraceae bacterium]